MVCNKKYLSAQVGSLANINHTPGGGKVKILNETPDFSKVESKVRTLGGILCAHYSERNGMFSYLIHAGVTCSSRIRFGRCRCLRRAARLLMTRRLSRHNATITPWL
jgi:hypothetical protein